MEKILYKINKLIEDPIEFLINNNLNTLLKILKYANQEYYNNKPIISDMIYDLLLDTIKDIDPNNSIFKQIGAKVTKSRVNIPHYMGSMNKIKTNDINILAKWLNKYSGPYVYSDKLDGISALFYNNNNTLKLVTRGNGYIGMDISRFIKYFDTLNNISIPNNYAIRGELIINKTKFDEHQKTIIPPPANGRNMIGGIINSIKIHKYIKDVEFIAYELIYPWYTDQNYQWKILEELNFKVVFNSYIKDTITIDLLKDILSKRKLDSIYDIDGIIISNNILPTIRETDNNPNYAFAFKDITAQESKNVKILEIIWNISKDGYIKPKIKCEPVKLGNVTISHVTAFNAKYVKDNILGPGAIIKIIRSGDVIPHIIEIIKQADNGKPQFPNYNYSWNESNIDIIINEETKEQKIKELTFFCKKLNIKDINEKIIEKFINNGIDNIKKIIEIEKDDLLNIDGFKDKMIDKIYNNIINIINNLTLKDLAISSNYFGHGLGKVKLEKIMNIYPNIIDLYNNYSSNDIIKKITKIKGFDIKTANQFSVNLNKFVTLFNSLNDKLKIKLINSCILYSSDKNNNLFKNMNIVFSGFRDHILEEFIINNGGNIINNISNKTSLLITTEKALSIGNNIKIIKAIELNIVIITKEEFINKYLNKNNI